MKFVLLPLLITAIAVILIFLGFGDLELIFNTYLDMLRKDKISYMIISFLILSSDILLPVPSSIVMYLNGTVAGFFYGGILSLASGTAGSVLGYYIGRFSRKSLQKYLSPDQQEKSDHLFDQYGPFILIISRGIPILAESMSITAGFRRQQFLSYLLLSILGYVPVCFLYSLLGQLGKNENQFLMALLISAGFTGLFWVVNKILGRRNFRYFKA